MNQVKEKRKRVWTYLNSSEKQALTKMAEANNQSLSEYIRTRLTKRTNKVQLSPHVIADRVLLSRVKQSIMMLKVIAQGNSDDASKKKMLIELNNLTAVIDPAILALIGASDDSSDLPER